MATTTDGAALRRSVPEARGVRSEGILAFVDALEAGRLSVHSLMLVRHGHVVAEGWWRPYTPACRRYLYSLSKSFTSTAVGLAAAEGLLKVDDKVISFFPAELPPSIDANLAAMRVRDLLTMTTGHSFDSTMALVAPGLVNWVEALLALPVEYTPGTHFLYNSGASYLLSAIVQKVTGRTELDYLTPRLFQPLGITDVTWDVCPRGINTGGWGLSLKTEDIAKLGLLYLQKGVWNGRQLVPRAWVEEATALQVRNDGADRENASTDWRQGYGYQFWRCQHGAYRADGAFGQYCVVVPDRDAVIAITSETDNMQGILDLAWQYLLPAMEDAPIPGQPAAQARLHERLAALELAAPPAQPHPPLAAAVSGERFQVQPNEFGVQSVSFSFEAGCCCFRLCDGRGEHQIVCGNGVWVENEALMRAIMLPSLMFLLFGPQSQGPVKVAAHGAWADAQTYVMTWQYLETPHADTVTCRFLGDEVQLAATSSMRDPSNPLLVDRVVRLAGILGQAV